MQKVQNFGSLLQSYSLKKILESYGYEVNFIDIEPNASDEKLVGLSRLKFDKENEKSSRYAIISKLYRIDKYFFNRILHKKELKRQEEIFENFRKNELYIKEKSNVQKYDVCVIGSDEVFNCMSDTPWGFTSQLFGEIKQTDKVILYAASCGSTTYDVLPYSVAEKIRKSFEHISAFSVRDENTYQFVRKLTNKNQICLHYDPVVIADFTKEISDVSELEYLPQHYCAVYSYYNRMNDYKDINAIKRFCRKNKLEIISLGAPQMWIKHHYILSPFELLKAFQKAEYIITDTFHGTIFATKYANKFVTIVRDSNKNKLLDLVEKLEIKEHLAEDIEDIQRIFLVQNDQRKMQYIEKTQRKIAEQYFENSI